MSVNASFSSDLQREAENRQALITVLCIVLWCASLISGLAVVYSTYSSRQAVQQLEALRREAIGLKVSSGQYQLERSVLGAYPRVESIASDQLNMLVPPTEKTILVILK